MMQVALVMGSISDWPQVKNTADLLSELHVSYDSHVISAHRMPQELQHFGQTAKDEHYQVMSLVL